MPSDLQAKLDLGRLGEEIAAMVLWGKSTDDWFDSEKDMTDPDGRSVEIKTQYRIDQYNYLSVPMNKKTNYVKCMTVDRLIFVEYDHSDIIRIWEVQDRDHYTEYYANLPSCGRTRMVGWYINKNEVGPGLKLIREIKLPLHASIMRYFSPAAKFKHCTQF